MNALVVVPTTTWYLLLSAVLFTIGTIGVLVRRNPLVLFMCIELMLNAVNLSFVALGRRLADINGQTIVFFVLVISGFAIFLLVKRAPLAFFFSLILLSYFFLLN